MQKNIIWDGVEPVHIVIWDDVEVVLTGETAVIRTSR
jgi:hypothetical protein